MHDAPSTTPLAPCKPSTRRLHGEERQDPYAWLRASSAPEVEAWLSREEAHARHVLAPLQPLRQRLHEEMLARRPLTDSTPPARRGDFVYYTREPRGLGRPVHCRRGLQPDAPEEVVLDENRLAADHPAFCLGGMCPSPDQNLLLFAVDERGDERFTLRIKDLRTGALLEDRVEGVGSCAAWTRGGHSFFYVSLDESLRPDRLHHHVLGTPGHEDTLVWREEDAAFRLSVSSTESEDYVKLLVLGKNTSEVFMLPADEPLAPPRPVMPRRTDVLYDVTHGDGVFYLLTNDAAPNFRVLVASTLELPTSSWHELVPHREDVLVCHLQAFARHLVLSIRKHGLRELEVVDMHRARLPATPRPVPLPEPVHSLFPLDNLDFHGHVFRFGYASPLTPDTVFEYDLEEHRLTRLHQEEIPGFDADDYSVSRLMAPAPDGEHVPLSVIHLRRLSLDGTHPLVLYGYGAYGLSIDPGFSSELLSLLDRGVVFAIAHVRGGSERGQRWHAQGKLLNKQTSISDFLACAEHLVNTRYTAPGRIAAMGESAGGTLVGAAVNLRPELFGVVVAEMPFVDLVDTLLDERLPLTPTEWEEWGNPLVPEHYRVLRAYSPYDNVARLPYPAMLVTAGLQDSRVPFWEPVRWVARLRAATTSTRPLVLHLLRDAGHAGVTGTRERLWERALCYAFVLTHLT